VLVIHKGGDLSDCSATRPLVTDGRMLITEKVGPIWLVTGTGERRRCPHVPPCSLRDSGGHLLGVFLSGTTTRRTTVVRPDYAEPAKVLQLVRGRAKSRRRRGGS